MPIAGLKTEPLFPVSVNLLPPERNREAMDDDELIAAMAGGDDTALRELFARHAPWLAARLRPILPAAEVEDVLQESFLAVWRGASGYRPEGSPGGWLWGITRRQAALWLRRRGPDGLPLAVLAGHGGQQAGDPAEAAVARAELAEAVRALGPGQRRFRRVAGVPAVRGEHGGQQQLGWTAAAQPQRRLPPGDSP